MNKTFYILYKALLAGKKIDVEPQLLDGILRCASLNKVLLHFLRVIDFNGGLREAEERRLDKIAWVVERIVRRFKNVDYVFYKLVKPVVYVPSDVDLLVNRKHIHLAVSMLRDLGFRVELAEPYCVTMISRNLVVDVYVHPTIGGMVYLDGERLLEYRRTAIFCGLEVPTLEDYVEALVAAAHAVYKERIYTLNDYFTVSEWVLRKSFDIADELDCLQALRFAMNLNRGINDGLLETPFRIPVLSWLVLLWEKFYSDGLTRVTSPNILRALRSQRSGKILFSKLTRISY
ncbi:MAG: nucleotidyltransferase family protein [Candidatus Baldrarchaeia archaeon]